jgi:hypothetical protein
MMSPEALEINGENPYLEGGVPLLRSKDIRKSPKAANDYVAVTIRGAADRRVGLLHLDN